MLKYTKHYMRYILMLIGILFTAEYTVMTLLQLLDLENILSKEAEALIDSLSLLVVSSVPIYFLIVKPLIKISKGYQEHLENLVKALEGASDAVLITDADDGNIMYVNKTFTDITGYATNEVLGHNPKMLQSGKQSKSFYKMMWRSIDATGEWQGEIWNKRKDGETYPESLRIKSVTDEGGKVKFYIGIFSDITEQRNRETLLRQSQKMEALGTMVGGVAHNFNNMLAGIMGKSFLARKKSNESEVIQYLQDIEGISQDAASMIKQLLSFAHTNSEQRKKSVAIVPVIESAVSIAGLSISKEIEFTTDFTGENLLVYCDPVEIEQTMINIINNARDAVDGSKERRISVNVEPKPWEGCPRSGSCSVCNAYVVHVTIKDTGSGISETDIEHIFDPFFTTKEVGKGTGLGLSMAKGVIESHGGIIHVNSAVGVGTGVEICLPITNISAAQKDVMPEGKSQEVALADDGETLLIIDADRVVRTTLNQIFSSLGYDVLMAPDGEEGMVAFNENADKVSLVVTAVTMPTIDGPAVIGEMRYTKPELPVVFVMEHDTEMADVNLQNDCLARVVSKPFNVSDLSHAVYALLHAEKH